MPFRNSDAFFALDAPDPNEPPAVGPPRRVNDVDAETVEGPTTERQRRRLRQFGTLMGYRYWVRDPREA